MDAPTLSPAAVNLLNLIAQMTPTPTDPWAKYPAVLGVEHVREIMDMPSVGAVRDAARRGSLPMTKRLGRWCVDQVAFRAWLAGGAR